MKIIIETIPHHTQRYPTVGDWYFTKEATLTEKGGFTEEVLHIKVSSLSDWRHEFLVILHELIEVGLCKHAGITQEAVDEYDIAFEKDRAAGRYRKDEEPGNKPNAPYVLQHGVASGVERIVAAELRVPWDAYVAEVEALP
jgi:hypothetical protein